MHTASILPHPGLISAASTDVAAFVLHTDATLKAVVERLDEVAKKNPGGLEELEHSLASLGILSGCCWMQTWTLRQLRFSCGIGCIATAWVV